MPKFNVLILVVAAGLICVGCPTEPTVDAYAEMQEIRELDRLWLLAFEEKDVENAMRFFAPDAVLMPAHTPAIAGRQPIREWFESWLPNPDVSSSFAPEKIVVAASGDLAYDRGTYEFSMETPEGRIRDVGKYLIVWKLIDGEWKAILDISNSDLASPELQPNENIEVTEPVDSD